MLLVKLYAMERVWRERDLVGVGLVAPALAIAALSLPLGRLADRLGRMRSIRWGLTLAAGVVWSVVAPRSHRWHGYWSPPRWARLASC
jgi:MFS family permease